MSGILHKPLEASSTLRFPPLAAFDILRYPERRPRFRNVDLLGIGTDHRLEIVVWTRSKMFEEMGRSTTRKNMQKLLDLLAVKLSKLGL